jgi:hypothetical protein
MKLVGQKHKSKPRVSLSMFVDFLGLGLKSHLLISRARKEKDENMMTIKPCAVANLCGRCGPESGLIDVHHNHQVPIGP